MIEQQPQQFNLNSIMIASNCNKYFSHNPSTAASSSSLTKKIMSNSDVSGATISAPAAAMNNSNKTNGMSDSVGGSGAAPTSPQAPAISNKMGSRRIFSPHFKIQVLESYRNDSDCKGNQRATARKYGIHRRQIQKWLQCETTLRNSVGNKDPSTSPPTMSAGGSLKPQRDSNNNRPQTALNQARHCVDSFESGAVRVAATAAATVEASNRNASVSDTNTVARFATSTRQNSMEFFSPLSTTSLIINGEAVGGGESDGARKIESMNGAVTIPIKPEFGYKAAAATPSSAVFSSEHTTCLRENTEMTAAMLKQHLYQMNGAAEETSRHTLLSATLPPPFISTIYGPQGLLAFPTPRLGAYSFDYVHAAPSLNHLPSPIDLSMGANERREILRHSSLALPMTDDARVPSREEHRSAFVSPLRSAEENLAAVPIDLSCNRKRKSDACPVEPVKAPKLFKPYLMDDHEEEEELKVVDEDDHEEEAQSTTSTKEDSFLDQDLAGLKDSHSRRFEYPSAAWCQHLLLPQYYVDSSPLSETQYYGHESLTLYPSPRQNRFELSSAASSPCSRPASRSASEATSDIRSSPPAISLDLNLHSMIVPPFVSNWDPVRSRMASVY